MTKNILQNLVKEFRELLDPIARAAGDADVRREILLALSLDPNQASQPINIPPNALASIDSYTSAAAEDVDLEAFASVVQDVLKLVQALESFINAARAGSSGAPPGMTLDEAVNAYLNMTSLGYVRVRWPGIYIGLKVLGLLEEQSIRFGGLADFLFKMGDYLETLYGDSWDLKTAAHAKNLSDGLLFLFGVAATAFLKADILYGWDADPASTTPLADAIADRTLSLGFEGETKDAGGNKVKAKLLVSAVLLPEEHQGPGVLIRLKGSGVLEVPINRNLSFQISVGAPDANIYLGKGNVNFPSSTDASVGVSLIQKSTEESKTIFGSANGTHLLFGKSTLEGKVSPSDYSLKLGTKDSSLTLAGDDADSFISKILPSGKLKTDFTFGIGYSQKRHFFIEGGAGFLVAIPLHQEVGPLNLQTLTLGFKAGDAAKNAAISVESSLSFATKLGPLTATVDRIGLSSDIDFPDGGGNLGPVNVAVHFKPPNGVGLAIDGGGFKGGGFLSFDFENEQYAGALELEYKDTIALKAIGLLNTRLPDGSKGFSLLIIISAEFAPIQLSFGFTLNGVGGLLGLNRTARIDRLRSGVQDNTLSSILFPQNLIANANRIISDLRQVFPPQPDRFIFGPMAKIGWGTPTLITIDLGLLIEVPDPVRIAILGVIKALLPDENNRLLRLQVNFLGVIDFEKQLLSFDASLYDSKLLAYSLSGDMALRLSWGSDPNFLLTVGGFHPAYTPPPNLELLTVRRLTLQLLGGTNPRLTLETYYAVTSNTVQFGAKAELYAAAGEFNVYGFLSFDVLFQFNPFYFIATIAAMLALRVGSSSIASISLKFTLEGTTPWKAKGSATLTICWFIEIKVRFNKTFGEERDTRLEDVAVLPQLQAALSSKGNWDAQPPEGRHALVSLKSLETAGDQIIAHPVGVLRISQKVVPLNIDIQKIGSQHPADGNRFSIEQVLVGEPGEAAALGTGAVPEQFAPAQFFEMSDAQKLARKSFERYDGGVKITDSENLHATYAAKRDVAYELFYVDAQRNLNRWPNLFVLEAVAFNAWATKGAVAASPLSFAKRAKSALAPEAITVKQEQYAVVNLSDLRPVSAAAVANSEAAAYQLMNEMIRQNPQLAGEIHVVSAFEVQTAASD